MLARACSAVYFLISGIPGIMVNLGTTYGSVPSRCRLAVSLQGAGASMGHCSVGTHLARAAGKWSPVGSLACGE